MIATSEPATPDVELLGSRLAVVDGPLDSAEEDLQRPDSDVNGTSDTDDLERSLAAVAMLRQLSGSSEGFASGSTVMAAAMAAQRQVVIVVNINHDAVSLADLSCLRCTYDEQGIQLSNIANSSTKSTNLKGEQWVDQLLGEGAIGDLLIVCDPWGDSELLCAALQSANHRRIATVAITTDQPNLLAAIAQFSIRVPVTEPYRRKFVITVLRHLMKRAGVGLISAQQRITGPLRELEID